MGMNKAGGNMYKWVTHTWNPIAGQCPHECVYCYVEDLKSKPVLAEKYSGDPRLVEKEMETNLSLDMGDNDYNVIFVQNCGDLFAVGVKDDDIQRVLEHCNEYPDNKYLIQTKNPLRAVEFAWDFPPNVIFGTTVESDYPPKSNAPHWIDRVIGVFATHLAFNMHNKKVNPECNMERMLSIEPIVKIHNRRDWLSRLLVAKPEFISIGADSKRMGLDEPEPWEVYQIVTALSGF
ncbi:MAG: DUF5131 family protein, partial [Candidatus Thorarchaeota archaeon]